MNLIIVVFKNGNLSSIVDNITNFKTLTLFQNEGGFFILKFLGKFGIYYKLLEHEKNSKTN